MKIAQPWLVDRVWVTFFAGTLLAWIALFTLALDHPAGPALGALSPAFDAAFWRSICAITPAGETLDRLIVMWALMTAAMMAPTAAPTVAAYRDLTSCHPSAPVGTAAFIGGYLAVWLGFAVLAAVAQYGLAAASLLSPHGVSIAPWLTAALLVGAGLYQFSTLKAACISKCRSPLGFLMSHWRAGPSGAFSMGLTHGLVCVGCCWALMLLAFVGGAMNLIWMGGAMALMLLEKLPDIGQLLTRPLGIILVLLGLLVAASTSGSY